eukprot:GEZU01029207.1.p1 GENE.GEZU01029207.1~~GEZU01029207.1.p1  ORF type:complete len:355 (+),score=105.12 GEZU01029207.1:91-1065(+)
MSDNNNTKKTHQPDLEEHEDSGATVQKVPRLEGDESNNTSEVGDQEQQDQREANQLADLYTAAEQQRRMIEQEIKQSPLISDKIDITSLAEEYQKDDPAVQAKIQEIAKKYSHIRKVRGDGNCFFRAFTYALFEQILEAGGAKEAEMQRIHKIITESKDKLVSQGFPEFAIEDFQETFLDQYEQLVVSQVQQFKNNNSSQQDQALKELLSSFCQQAISDYLISYMRFLVSGYLREHDVEYEPFLMGKTVDQFCKEEVEPMGVESDHIHIIALSAALGVGVRVEYLDSRSSQMAHTTNTGANDDTSRITITLLYRPGHYDILYPR